MLEVKNLLRGTLKKILHPTPVGLRRCGHDSYILRPRRIEGPHNIELGDRTTILRNSWLSTITEYAGERFHPRLVIGDDVYVGNYACIVVSGAVTISDGCVLSEHVYITDNSHGLSPAAGLIMRQQLVSKGEVRLGHGCFVGYRACIMPGVQLGEHCVVGANAVVTKSFPAFSMVAGVPARVIKTYSRETSEWVPVEEVVAEHTVEA